MTTYSPPRPRLGWRLSIIIVAVFFLIACVVGFGSFYFSHSVTSIEKAAVENVGPPWFQDVTDQLNLDFVHDSGPTGKYFFPEILGSGCGLIQDPDGTLYLYLLQGGGPNSKSVNRLFRQLPDGKFQDVTEGSNLGVSGYNMGVAIADINNDGLPDVLLTQYGGVKLFLNLGGGKFEDVTTEAGLSNPLWATSAAFLDYDRDGWMDLVVVNYVEYDAKRDCSQPNGRKDYCAPNSFKGTCSKLFHNLGPAASKDGKPGARVRFEDVSFASGIGRVPGPGLGVVCADFNADGWPDIFVANDGQPNRLWINQHNGTFKNEAVFRGVAYNTMGQAEAGMGVTAGDFTASGMLDLFVTHLVTETNTLWCQGPPGHFRDRSAESGLASPRSHGTGFGTVAADFNLDGGLDIAVVNGAVVLGSVADENGLGFWGRYAEHNQLFANDGKGGFQDVSAANPALCGRLNVGRGLVCVDLDNDGAPDLVVTAIGDHARLFRNVAPNRGHWLKIRAVDPKLKRDAYGAEVRVRCGKRQWLRMINPWESFMCSGLPRALFGLGSENHFDAIQVVWPDGTKEEFDKKDLADGAVDREIVLRKKEHPTP